MRNGNFLLFFTPSPSFCKLSPLNELLPRPRVSPRTQIELPGEIIALPGTGFVIKKEDIPENQNDK